MKRKERILFMIVGTGISANSKEEGYKILAQKLYSTINKILPHHVIFFASDVSKHTIEYIEELFRVDNDEFIEGVDYQVSQIEFIDDFNACFELFESKIWEYDHSDDPSKYEIIMDYTSGTKTMSAAMACCGMFYNKDLISVGGDRTKGEVSAGTELIHYQNLYKIYDRYALMRVRSNFNANRFRPCIDILKYIIDLNIHKDSFLELCMAYFSWDNMEFNQAYEHLKNVNLNQFEFENIKGVVKQNLKALGTICNSRSENLKNCYILASLINNSIRRSEEYKFDDAIARLYRAFELIAQIRLSKYGINSSDVDIQILMDENVDQEVIDRFEMIKEDDKIRIGLVNDYLLLDELDDDLGHYFVENRNKINDLTYKRNNSILAHGLESLTQENFDKFLDLVVDLSKKLDKDMSKFLNQTKFPKFDLKLKINQG